MVTDYRPSSNLRTVSPTIVQDLTTFSVLKFFGVSDPIDGCAGWTVGPLMPPLVAPVDFFSLKLFFCLFLLWGVTYIWCLIVFMLKVFSCKYIYTHMNS